MNPAYSVIFFTTAAGAGYGLVSLAALFGLTGAVPVDRGLGAVALGLGTALVTGGLLSSTLHLGHPERAWRAFSQWRSSWLSREGVLAVVAYVPLGLTMWGWIGEGSLAGVYRISAIALVGVSVLTVVATGMIYATLRTVPAWRQRTTVPLYLLFAWVSGGLWFQAIAGAFGFRSVTVAVTVLAGIGVTWLVKEAYWRAIDGRGRELGTEHAIGLAEREPVRLLDAPHTRENFVQREMGYQVARKHAKKLRRIAMISCFTLPFLLTGLSLVTPAAVSVTATVLAALCASFGVVVERWLFFAEAKHISTLYYGTDRIQVPTAQA